MKNKYDLAVIGGGSAGYSAASTAAGLGLEVALIEGGPEVGGLCLLRGCMPSKTLIESANRALTIRRAPEFGLRAGKLGVEVPKIMERKRGLIEEFGRYRRQQLESGKFDFIRGMASFTGPHTLQITHLEDEPASLPTGTLEAKTFLIATGSNSEAIEIPGLMETGFHDSDAVLECDELPESVIVLGGGATAVEFSHYYSGLGAKVTILQRSRQLLKDMDADVAMALAAAFEHRGISVCVGTTILRVESAGKKKRVYFRHGGEERMVEGDEIVYGLGRVPQVASLGLEQAGVHLEKGRLRVQLTQQTDVSHIFAAGDAAGPHEIVHLAVEQGAIAARNAAKLIRAGAGPAPELEKMDYRLKLFAIFSMPEAAAIGMTEKELTAAGIPHLAASHPFHDHGKSVVMGETDGFVKLIVAQESREILGAAVIGIKASELIHEIAVAMYFHATATDLNKVPHYHPTLSEIWTYPAEDLALKS